MDIDKYKNAEWITIGSGPIRIKVIKASNLNLGVIYYLTKKLFEIDCDMNWNKKEGKYEQPRNK